MLARWQRAALLPLLAPLFGLGACGGAVTDDRPRQGDGMPAGADPTLAADSPIALTPYWPEGGAAVISGRLALEDGCLYLREADGGRILPTFPWPGTYWEPKDGTLTIFGSQRFRLGEILATGGGFATAEGGSDGRDHAALQRMLVVPRPQCDTARVAVLYFGANRPASAARADR